MFDKIKKDDGFSTVGRGGVYNNIIETIGNTPLVKIDKIASLHNVKANLMAKLEFFNPLSSVKDRLALSMIENAEKDGLIKKDTVIIEPTSGNTGIALAFICANRGYNLILTMPESMSIERRKILSLLGAKLDLTPASLGMKGAIDRANELVNSGQNNIILQQFKNKYNPVIHRCTTGPEIWNDTNGEIDIVVIGVGTGGTLTGVSGFLKEKNPNIKIVAVEPLDSPVLSGGKAGPHKIQGIGAGFIPHILNTSLIDSVEKISNDDAFERAREVAHVEGIPVGISSGATIEAAIRVGKNNPGKNIAIIVASSAERYLSTALFEQ